MTTNQYRTIPSYGHAGRSCLLAALILSVALLASGCLAPYGSATQGDVADLRKAQDDNFQSIKFALDKISAKLDTQDLANQSGAQTTLEQLARIREALNVPGGPRPVRPAVTPGALAPTPTPMPVATPQVRPVATPLPETTLAPPEPAAAVTPTPTPTPQPDTQARQEELLRTAKDEDARHNYDQAIAIYSTFLSNNPTAPGAPNAAYYMASGYYKKQDYEKALTGYKSVLDNYPGSTDIAAPTLLARAMCEMNLKRNAEARVTLLKIQSTYPAYKTDEVANMLNQAPQP